MSLFFFNDIFHKNRECPALVTSWQPWHHWLNERQRGGERDLVEPAGHDQEMTPYVTQNILILGYWDCVYVIVQTVHTQYEIIAIHNSSPEWIQGCRSSTICIYVYICNYTYIGRYRERDICWLLYWQRGFRKERSSLCMLM